MHPVLRRILPLLPFLAPGAASAQPPAWTDFIDQHCASCHDDIEKEAGLDLDALAFDPANPKNFARWVQVFDRVHAGEMPPKKKPRPAAGDLTAFTSVLSAALTAAERTRVSVEGRATRRRLNRHEYENTLRDLLQTPWLQVKDALPEDGVMHRFNKIGDALDVSHVQMARYLVTADHALRQVLAAHAAPPPVPVVRYYAREQASMAGPMRVPFYANLTPWSTIPLLDYDSQPYVRRKRAPATVGAADPALREREAVGVTSGTFEPLYPKFDQFRAPADGRYKLRLKTYSIWVGAGHGSVWWIADLDNVLPGRRDEPVTLYADAPPNLLRRLGTFDAKPEPAVTEFEVWLLAGETIRTDAARLVQMITGDGKEVFKNHLATRDGQPGVAYNWLEVEGPLQDGWPSAGHRVLFGDLPLREGSPVEVVSADPARDAARLLAAFTARAYRRPVSAEESRRFLPLIERKLAAGARFAEAMFAGYTAVLCSPEFIYLEEKPGPLDAHAVASRLAFFLTDSAPDAELRALAGRGTLLSPETLRIQTDRLLDQATSGRFIASFLDYWLDLRRLKANAPDATLYNDYYLDDHLADSALEETRLFFSELLRADLPARNLINSDFAFVNERLAVHYGLWANTPAETASGPAEDTLDAPNGAERNLSVVQRQALPLLETRRPLVEGVAFRRVALPADSVRGGLLTQASVLTVTANGTTTSPVLRGAWIIERILGQPSPPPPPVPAVEPDLRGATTIREQLAKHRDQASCASCHSKIDPPGFALESFDVMGGWREKYRAVAAERADRQRGVGKNGQPFAFRHALPVDASGEMADGRTFSDIREFKQLLLASERQVARNLAQQLVIYATGAPIGFTDRERIDRILAQTEAGGFGVRSLVHAIVESDLFLHK